MQILHLQSLPLQLSNGAAGATSQFGSETASGATQGKNIMRIVETAAAGFVALAAQILVVATVMI